MEERPKVMNAEILSSEELGLELRKQYEILIQTRDNINVISQQLEKRRQGKESENAKQQ